MPKKETIALILAGGQGSRLKALTKSNAKPAVPFAGKYRIIDFTLSNCANSYIDTVGVLTQYQPLILNAHIGIGSAWDLDRVFGGVRMLPPYMSDTGGYWYKGTADAVYRNFNYIDYYSPDYVLVLSGDHIYKMDYSVMLKHHVKNNADCSIAVIEVPISEANRFGIMSTLPDGRIFQFDEKPANPKSNMASMGVYIFNWAKLKEILLEDQNDPTSSNDFGKNIIPKMLSQGSKMYAYRFDGYWKDVGTLDSYWQASMDLIYKENAPLDLFEEHWKIYAADYSYPPQFIGENAKIKKSMIADGCTVLGLVENSILSQGVFVGENAVVRDSVVFSNVTIEANAKVNKCIVNSRSLIKENLSIGDGMNVVLFSDDEIIE